jgi:hypothetical protein
MLEHTQLDIRFKDHCHRSSFKSEKFKQPPSFSHIQVGIPYAPVQAQIKIGSFDFDWKTQQ